MYDYFKFSNYFPGYKYLTMNLKHLLKHRRLWGYILFSNYIRGEYDTYE